MINAYDVITPSYHICIKLICSFTWLHSHSLSLLSKIMEEKLVEEGDFLAAIERFTEAITLNRNNYQLFGQRSAAYARIGRFTEALEDAKRCHELKPDWSKVS